MFETRLTANLPSSWWREAEVLLLLLVVAFGYFYRASEMSMRGEEPRRALVAVEMIDRHDWVVPRDQEAPFLSRPPLHNWLIALSFLGLDERDVFGARLPSLLATLFTSLLLYGYGRTFLSRTGALAAGIAYATFGEIFQTGRMAETEAVFILLVSCSVLLWHWGVVRNWPAAITWGLGYGLMALAGLTKGPQAPAYFLGTVGVYSVLVGQWRRLFSFAHLFGILVAASILAAWHVPYYQAVGAKAVWGIWMNDTAPRLFEWAGFLRHFVVFPVEVLGCTLPWSPLILLFLRRDVRQSVGNCRPQVLCCTICAVLGFLSCWLPPGGMTRYLTPIYPCMAVLLGFVVQRCGEADPSSALGRVWRAYLAVLSGAIVVCAVALPVVSLFGSHPKLGVWAEPVLLALALAVCFLGLAWLVAKSRANMPRRTGWSVVAIAGFMVLLFNGPILDARIRRGEDNGTAIRLLKERLPADATFVSLGLVDSEFAFFYGKFPKPLPWPSSTPPAVPLKGYFCFTASGVTRPELPFAWEEIAAISMDRNRHPVPEKVLVVARRLPM